MNKLRIGLDFDDVLIASAEHTIRLHNQRYGSHVSLDDWYDATAVAPWGLEDFAQVVERVVDVQAGDDFLEVEPLRDAQEVLHRLKKMGHELIVVTGRPSQLEVSTRALLTKYYGDSIDPSQLRFTDHFGHEGKRINKGDIAVELSLTHFVDDVIQHANNVASKGITTVLFGENYKWNQAEPDQGVIRIGTWKALGEFFEREAA